MTTEIKAPPSNATNTVIGLTQIISSLLMAENMDWTVNLMRGWKKKDSN